MRYFNSIANIPELLRLYDNWLCWQKGHTDGRGKFPKYPVNPLNPSMKINYQDPRFLQSFDTAFNFYNLNNEISGLGFKLDGKKIYYPKTNFKGYLTGIDIDLAEGRDEQFFKKIIKELGDTYSEISPSGKGIRLFGLTNEKVDNWSHNHIEVYTDNRFLTVTGWDSKGDIKNISKFIKAFNKKYKPDSKTKSIKNIHQIKFPTPNEIANVHSFLYSIDADCSGDQYRNIVFGILSLGWGEIGINMLKTWSLTAPHRWSEDYFNDLVNRYDTDFKGTEGKSITIGTVIHYARQNQDGRPF